MLAGEGADLAKMLIGILFGQKASETYDINGASQKLESPSP
jgi:hypothetical protein